MKKAIIIGASSGIRKDLAIVLVEYGYEVGLMARHVEKYLHPEVQLISPLADITRKYKLDLNMADIKATIFFDKRYWVGIFERMDKEGYAVAKHIFGIEPADTEVYEFVLNHYQELKFGEPKEFTLEIKRMNPKRVQKEVRREMERMKETTKPSTFAQDYMREEIEKKKVQKRHQSNIQKQARKEEQFALKQEKKKEKHRGH